MAKKEEASSGSHKQRKTMPLQPPGYPMGEHRMKDPDCRCGRCSTTWPLEARDA